MNATSYNSQISALISAIIIFQRQDFNKFLEVHIKQQGMNQRKNCDRFIPIRNQRQMRIQVTYSAQKMTQSSTNYSRILSPQSSKYLKFTTPDQKQQSLTDFLYKSLTKKQSKNLYKSSQQTRKAIRILDAPDVVNNFYYNPLDWSKSNRIGIALSQSAYFFEQGKQVLQLQRCSNIQITCLKFHYDDSLCLLGDGSGRIDVYDCEKRTRVRQVNVHYNRVGVIQNFDKEVFISGSKDKLIKLNDLRLRKTDIITMEKHIGEICGLATNKNYLASGGNDNKVIIWDLRKNLAINEIKEHKSAVKALAWCPWKTNLLASGGGRHDKKIIFWNGNKSVVQNRFQTESQVIALQWKEETQQLVSGHFCGKSSYCLVWNGLDIKMKLKGHEARLLGMKLSPNKAEQLCTIASDETLRFWDISTDQSKRLSSKMKLSRTSSKEFDNLSFR